MALFGVAYAVASLGCTIGPFLATVVVTFRTSTFTSGLVTFLAYAAGMGLAVGAAALAVALSRGSLGRLRRWGPLVTRLGGGLLVAAGGYVAYYGWYEIRVLRGGSGEDPVIRAAEQVQGALEDGLGWLGPGGVAVLVGLMVAVPLLVWVRIRARRRRDRAPAGSSAPAGDG